MTSSKHLPQSRFLPPLLPSQKAATQPAPAAAAATQGAQLGSPLLRSYTNVPAALGAAACRGCAATHGCAGRGHRCRQPRPLPPLKPMTFLDKHEICVS